MYYLKRQTGKRLANARKKKELNVLNVRNEKESYARSSENFLNKKEIRDISIYNEILKLRLSKNKFSKIKI